MGQTKYDVFISYSRKDYAIGKEIIPNNAISAIKQRLEENDISFWFDEEGIYSGQKFVDIITEAIADSKVFLFISSINSNSNKSKWTRSEIFEAFDTDKPIIPLKIDECDYHKSLKFYLRPLDFISFYENREDAPQELVRSIIIIKRECEEKERIESELNRINEIKIKISNLAKDYRMMSMKQEIIWKDLIKYNKAIGREEKSCPVCEKKVPIEATNCDRCGWFFSPINHIDGSSDMTIENDTVVLCRANWKIMNEISNYDEEINKIKQLHKRQLSEKESDIENIKISHRKTLDDYERRIKVFLELKDKLHAQISEMEEKLTANKSELDNKNLLIGELESKASKYELLLDARDKELSKNIGKLNEYEKETSKRVREAKEREEEISALKKHIIEQEMRLKETEQIADECKKELAKVRKEKGDISYKMDTVNERNAELEKIMKGIAPAIIMSSLSSSLSSSLNKYLNDKQKKTIPQNNSKKRNSILEFEWHQLVQESKINRQESIFGENLVKDTIDINKLISSLNDMNVSVDIDKILDCRTIRELKNLLIAK